MKGASVVELGRARVHGTACALALLLILGACHVSGNDRGNAGSLPDDSLALRASFERAGTLHDQGELDSALRLAAALRDSAQELGLPVLEVNALGMQAKLLRERGDLNRALALNAQALAITLDHGARADEGNARMERGLILELQGRLDTALTEMLQAEAIAEETGDSLLLARCLHNLTHLYVRMEDAPKGMASLRRSIAIKQHTGDVRGMARSIGYLGHLLAQFGPADSAILFMRRGIVLLDSIQPGKPVVDDRVNLGLALDEMGQDDSAMAVYREALRFAEAQHYPVGRTVLLNNIGHLLLERGEGARARDYFEKSLSLADSIRSLEDMIIGHESLSLVHERSGNMAAAFAEYRLADALRDSLLDADRAKAMDALLVRHDTERKEQENERLRQDRKLADARADSARWGMLAAVTAALLLVLGGLALLRRARARARERERELEQQALRLQMDPHFLFNALTSIPGLYATADHATASTYVEHLSDLLRLILETSGEKEIALRQELRITEHYLHVCASRTPGRLTWDLDLPTELDQDAVVLPPMLLQPLIENAISHGLAARANGGHVRIDIGREGKALVCRVSDNGVGRAASAHRRAHNFGSGNGLRLTAARIERFNRGSGIHEGLSIVDLAHDDGTPQGTLVILRITCPA